MSVRSQLLNLLAALISPKISSTAYLTKNTDLGWMLLCRCGFRVGLSGDPFQLVFLRNLNCEVFSPNQFAAPAAKVQTLVNGTICTHLPEREQWLRAYNNDIKLCVVRELALNPL